MSVSVLDVRVFTALLLVLELKEETKKRAVKNWSFISPFAGLRVENLRLLN